ncbi:MAG: serine/threonine-protein kinase, partial [Pirellulales bacterium]
MKQCSSCGHLLPDANGSRERCPACGTAVVDGSRSSDVAATIDSYDGGTTPHVSLTIDGQPDEAASQVVPKIDGDARLQAPNLAPTLDSDAGLAPPRIEPTIESHGLAAPSVSAGESRRTPPGSPPPVTKRAKHTPYDPTIDSDVASPADEARIASIWGSSLAGTSPSASLRSSQDSGPRPRSVQTVRERAIGPIGDSQAPNADYQIVGPLGEGGMGVVYTARQSSIDREVAVKMLKPDLMVDTRHREKFLSEAVVTGELEHPGIVPIYDMGTDRNGALFYSMKKIQGTPWSHAIREKSLAENLDILLKVADAVAFAHSRDVIHRDLKPENVMLGGFGEVLLMDWGLAVSVAVDPRSPNVARTTSMGGTPAYMAPEMAIGPFDKIGKSSDIYLLGAILFECVTGKMPHYAKSSSACLAAAGRNEIVKTDVSGELLDIALRAMATKPVDRFASVQELQNAIREYQSHTESIVMAGRAAVELEKARGSDDYRDYNRALFGYEEAWELWSKNAAAAEGAREARLAYARSAQRKGDFDLGLSLLTEDEPGQNALRDELLAALQEREARLHRLRTARRVVLGLAALVFVAITAGIVLVSMQKAEADRLRVVAQDNEVEATRQAGLARDSASEANRQAGLARDNAREALRLKGVADDQREQTEYEAYRALVGLAAAKIEENAFDRADELLQQCKPELRNWEWGRLMYLCRQGVSQIFVGDRVECIAP